MTSGKLLLGILFGFLAGALLTWGLIVTMRIGSAQANWDRFESSRRTARKILSNGGIPSHPLIVSNRVYFDALVKQGEIVKLLIPELVSDEMAAWLHRNDIAWVLPLDAMLGGQRAPGIFYVHAFNRGAVEVKVREISKERKKIDAQ